MDMWSMWDQGSGWALHKCFTVVSRMTLSGSLRPHSPDSANPSAIKMLISVTVSEELWEQVLALVIFKKNAS